MERAQDEMLSPAGLWGQAIPAKHGFEARLLFDPREVDAVTHFGFLRAGRRAATVRHCAPRFLLIGLEIRLLDESERADPPLRVPAEAHRREVVGLCRSGRPRRLRPAPVTG